MTGPIKPALSASEWKLCPRERTKHRVRIILIGPWLTFEDRWLIAHRREGRAEAKSPWATVFSCPATVSATSANRCRPGYVARVWPGSVGLGYGWDRRAWGLLGVGGSGGRVTMGIYSQVSSASAKEAFRRLGNKFGEAVLECRPDV